MEAVLLDPAGECVQRLRRPTHKESYDAFMRQLLTLIADIRAVSPQPFTLGIGLPGAIDPQSGRIKTATARCSTVTICAGISCSSLASRCGWQTMPTASPFRRRWMAPAPELPPSSG